MRDPTDTEVFRQLRLIRRFEETVLQNFSTGVFSGTTHTYLGQEANAVGVLWQRDPDDIVFSNHRCHGHFLAYGGDVRMLFAELMGRSTGVCGGRGGSQHLQWGSFYSNGILGGTVAIATGMALAERQKGSGAVVVVFIGDGAFGEGIVYESLNMASLWGVPILFVAENNHVAQSTPVELEMAGDIASRFHAFGIECHELDTSDVREIVPVVGDLRDEVRTSNRPRALLLHTCRFGPHSKGDDPRSTEELTLMRETRDPLVIHGSRLDDVTRQSIEAEVEAQVQDAYDQALSDPVATFNGRAARAIGDRALN